MKKLLSPRQVARAIGVSESSLKRWCDRGLLRFEKTAGGHRRLPYAEVVRFVREREYQLKDPAVLGLPAATGQSDWTINRARERFQHALIQGEETVCRRIVIDLYLARHPVSMICDQVISESFQNVGNLWECGDVEVYQERRACELSLRVMHELRQMVGPPEVGSPLAIGGTLDGDPYTVAVTMAEIVLRSCGWNACSLGNMLPFSTLKVAIRQQRPQLVWLSVSAIANEERFVAEMLDLFSVCSEQQAALVIGGRAIHDDIRRQIRFTTWCESFQNLNDFCRTLL